MYIASNNDDLLFLEATLMSDWVGQWDKINLRLWQNGEKLTDVSIIYIKSWEKKKCFKQVIHMHCLLV